MQTNVKVRGLLCVALAVFPSLSLSPHATAATPPAAPPNAPAEVAWDPAQAALTLRYHGIDILEAHVYVKTVGGQRPARAGEVVLSPAVTGDERIEQRLTLAFAGPQPGTELVLQGAAHVRSDAFPAETLSDAQKRFPLVRNSDGRSRNLRNNAIYDRRWDWVLIGEADGRTRIEPRSVDILGRGAFSWESRGPRIELTFRPLFYQRHKNLRYFEPWTYPIRKDSITGWCSWWAYRADFTQKDLDEVVTVFAEKHLADFGYRYIQIDDAYQGGSGTPQSWLAWNGKFPAGIKGYSKAVRDGGFEPAIWIGVFFRDGDIVGKHPDWFVRKADGKPFKGPWIEYGIDSTATEAAETLIRPTYRGFRDNGFTYVKIDALRHLLYDSLHCAPSYGKDRNLSGDAVFRRYLSIAREELGPDTFVLACWGVLPEAIGLVDGCRLGTDGFGPCTMQQYSSWNGIVWRSDPDHCDILPDRAPKRSTPVRSGDRVLACPNETLLRPTLASLASAMLMLSDRADVYRKDENIEGVKRASPVLFTVPGQLYDYDPVKSDKVIALNRADVVTGGPPSPIDADQRGAICPYWMLEIARPFETWNVLARMNWGEKPMDAAAVAFADLGLPADREYLVYEFWSRRFLGVCRGSFTAEPLDPLAIRLYAIRAKLDRPQFLSTSRHISQGGADLDILEWIDGSQSLFGRSRVVRDDPYEITVYAPERFVPVAATVDGKEATFTAEGPIVRLAFTPSETSSIPWDVRFEIK